MDSEEVDYLLSNFYTLNISSRTLTALRDVTTVTLEEYNEANNRLRREIVLGAITPDHASFIYSFAGIYRSSEWVGTRMVAPITFDDDPVELNGDADAISLFAGSYHHDRKIYRFATNGRLLIDERLFTFD